MKDARKHRLINESVRDLCRTLATLTRVAPDAAYYVWEAVKEARKVQRSIAVPRGQIVEYKGSIPPDINGVRT